MVFKPEGVDSGDVPHLWVPEHALLGRGQGVPKNVSGYVGELRQAVGMKYATALWATEKQISEVLEIWGGWVVGYVNEYHTKKTPRHDHELRLRRSRSSHEQSMHHLDSAHSPPSCPRTYTFHFLHPESPQSVFM